MGFLLEASFYIMGGLFIMPYAVFLGWLTRVLRVERSAALLLVPSGSLAILVADLWFIGDKGCNPLYGAVCDVISVVGWIFYFPVLAVLFVLNLAALGMIIPATIERWRKNS